MTPLDDATRAQIAAADPARSTWLSANAGSGKTRVLTDRVARLLLADTDPRRILCLTYTKAAAGEMQNRLFSRLGAWAMLQDDRLEAELRALGVEGPIDLRKARTLFAAAIETPGGLKIQTIHSFCAALLRHYPLEAGVSPRFTELDETTDRLLMAEVAEALADGDSASVVDDLARFYGGQDFDKLTASIVQAAEAFGRAPDPDDVWRACDLPPGLAEEDIAAQVFSGSERALLDTLLPVLRAGKSTDTKAADRLAALAGRDLTVADLPILESCFLYGEDAKAGAFASKAGAFPTKDARAALGPVLDDLNDLMDRVAGARRVRLTLEAARKTLALRRFAARFLPLYEARKRERGWLSFDDLIRKARDLLRDPAVADWVLYRLDGGIDHILVDEAQDTSPAQWEVIEHLAREFTSGEGARTNRQRTLFVVGDKKQSIYSFQGADAEGFDRMRQHFEERLRPVSPLARRELLYSFRSSTAVLATVDRTFAALAAGGVTPDLRHHAYHGVLPGRVDVWPLLEASPKDEDGDWEKPVDRPSPDHHLVRLAQSIANGISGMLARGETIPDRKSGFRRLTPGDILILVQRRQGKPSLFAEIIAALKARRLPVAGADRMRLKDSLAVRDLLALLSFLALPEDDLSLAAALRSPLFGWSEQEIYALARGRPGFLWEALRARRSEYLRVQETLDDLRKEADFLRPYDLLERILVRHDGRNRLLARLGPEAEDGIDALQNLALAYERAEVPSLTGFLSWLEAEDTEIRRQLESAGGRIRVMTVHGSKGLEAPMVILPDTVRRKEQKLRSEIVVGDDGKGWWVTPRNASPAIVDRAREAALAAEERERERLLYVAMTRAQTWLVVCGAGDAANAEWHHRIREGVAALGSLPIETPTGEGLRYQHGDWETCAATETAPAPAAPVAPLWLTGRAPPPPEPPRPLSPSDLGGPKALPGEAAFDEEAALRRGRQIHRLLEHLPAYPQDEWRRLAPALLAHGEDATTQDEAAGLLAEVTRILTDPALAPLFAADTLAEVSLTAELPGFPGRVLSGTIDRLIVAADKVLVVDFKTNAVVPATPADVPDGLIRQMGAYAAALHGIYPGRRIETAILWTRTAALMPLPHEMVMAALGRTPTS